MPVERVNRNIDDGASGYLLGADYYILLSLTHHNWNRWIQSHCFLKHLERVS